MSNMDENEIIFTPTDNSNKFYCESCNSFQETQIKNVTETYTVRGEPITIDAIVRYCLKCNEPVFDEELDTENINKAYDIFRAENEYLTSEEIEMIRNTFGLSQRGFAALLDWSPSTVARYETGAVPSPSHHTTLMMLRDDFQIAKSLFSKKKHLLGNLDIKRMSKKIEEIENSESNTDIVDLLTKKYKQFSNSELDGFIDFDFNKLSNIILYLTNNISKVSKTKLMKLLFYLDFRHYKEYGLSISGLVYQHLPYGPVPSHHWLLLDALTESQVMELKPFPDFEGEYVEPKMHVDLNVLDEEEITTIDGVIKSFSDFNAEKISNYSHSEDAYEKTQNREFISFEFADTLRG